LTAFAAALAIALSFATLMPGVAVSSAPAAVVPVPLLPCRHGAAPGPAPRMTAAIAVPPPMP
jgi:hypothetical protein